MIRHLGPTCRVCGCPLRPGDELASGICDPCYDWQAGTSSTSDAISYSAQIKQREQRDAWVAMKRKRAGEER